MHEELKLFQFQMRLNDIYQGIRNNLLLTKLLPTVNYVYNSLMQEQNQRVITSLLLSQEETPIALYSVK